MPHRTWPLVRPTFPLYPSVRRSHCLPRLGRSESPRCIASLLHPLHLPPSRRPNKFLLSGTAVNSHTCPDSWRQPPLPPRAALDGRRRRLQQKQSCQPGLQSARPARSCCMCLSDALTTDERYHHERRLSDFGLWCVWSNWNSVLTTNSSEEKIRNYSKYLWYSGKKLRNISVVVIKFVKL